tara:strand:+ start:11139 stop:12071 length:933 start_codon:yes stop_codon:yes gene_type:complete
MTSLIKNKETETKTETTTETKITTKTTITTEIAVRGNDKNQDMAFCSSNSTVGIDGHGLNTMCDIIESFVPTHDLDSTTFTSDLIIDINKNNTHDSGATYTRMNITPGGDLFVEWCGDSIIMIFNNDREIVWSNDDNIPTYEVYCKKISSGEMTDFEYKCTWGLSPRGINKDGIFQFAQTKEAYFTVPSIKKGWENQSLSKCSMYNCLGRNCKMDIMSHTIEGFVKNGYIGCSYSDGISDVFNPRLEPSTIDYLMNLKVSVDDIADYFTSRWICPHICIDGPNKGVFFEEGLVGHMCPDDIYFTRISVTK